MYTSNHKSNSTMEFHIFIFYVTTIELNFELSDVGIIVINDIITGVAGLAVVSIFLKN